MQQKKLKEIFLEFLDTSSLQSRQKNLAISLLGLTEQRSAYALTANDAMERLLPCYVNQLNEQFADILQAAIHDSLINYTSVKQNAITIYKTLCLWLERKYHLPIPKDWINKLKSPQNRDWAIIKMSCDNMTIGEIADQLLTTEHTIRADINKMNQAGFLFIDRYVKIDGMEFSNGQLRFTSTPHPVLLMENLLSVLTMLESLRQFDNMRATDIPFNIALKLWQQLSDYARKTIRQRIGQEIFQSDIQWYDRLDSCLKNDLSPFQSELQMTKGHLPDRLLMVFKGGEPCKLVYKDSSGEIVMLKETRVVHLNPDDADFVYQSQGQKQKVNVAMSQILACEPLTAQ